MPGPLSASLTASGAVMLAVSFPDFELWFFAWFAFVPFIIGLVLENSRRITRFLLGWLFGTTFFFATCWWLTFAPITYAGFPVIPTFFLLLIAAAAAGIFPAMFGLVFRSAILSSGSFGLLLTPFLWTATEFLRYWITGNNWNAVGYSQAFNPTVIGSAAFGGVLLTGFTVVLFNSLVAHLIVRGVNIDGKDRAMDKRGWAASASALVIVAAFLAGPRLADVSEPETAPEARLVAVQPNVPMNGLNFERWRNLRTRQIRLAESELEKDHNAAGIPVVVVLPESPMNYQYESDPEFRAFINGFAVRNGAYVLFNSAEPDPSRESGFFNSAVMIDPKGNKVAQYDKIHLLPFGEFVPLPEFAQGLVPPMVGRFSFGQEYDLIELGKAKAGIMICFESHFGSLSAEYVRRGADVIIEMTNDGYLGNTPVLRQHLANAVFRAVESGRPVLRVTNVGVTASISPGGEVTDIAKVYREDVRSWKVIQSLGGQTIYVRYGDWFAVLSVLVSVLMIAVAASKSRREMRANPESGP